MTNFDPLLTGYALHTGPPTIYQGRERWQECQHRSQGCCSHCPSQEGWFAPLLAAELDVGAAAPFNRFRPLSLTALRDAMPDQANKMGYPPLTASHGVRSRRPMQGDTASFSMKGLRLTVVGDL